MEDGVRLNKFIAEAGVASRRGADKLIDEGHVTVNGVVAHLGTKVTPGDDVRVDGTPVKADTGGTVILAFNKPRGITCTANRDDPDNIIDFIGYPRRIFTVGRLDKDSEGLILLTNDGALADKIMRSRYGHEKEYVVTVDRDVTPDFLERMENGVELDDGVVTRRCRTELVDPIRFRIILRQGLNRQIRRMCEALGYNVKRLVRVRVMNVCLGKLREGSIRDLSKLEKDELYAQLSVSELAPKDE